MEESGSQGLEELLKARKVFVGFLCQRKFQKSKKMVSHNFYCRTRILSVVRTTFAYLTTIGWAKTNRASPTDWEGAANSLQVWSPKTKTLIVLSGPIKFIPRLELSVLPLDYSVFGGHWAFNIFKNKILSPRVNRVPQVTGRARVEARETCSDRGGPIGLPLRRLFTCQILRVLILNRNKPHRLRFYKRLQL